MFSIKKNQEKMLTIKFKFIVAGAYLYMLIPIMLFLSLWLKWYIGIPCTLCLLYGLIHLIKKEYEMDKQYISIPYPTAILLLLCIMLFLWATGQGGFFFQYSDNHMRNAIFSDLIDYEWPVIYEETNNALVYYLLHWLVPALIGKITASVLIARISLYIWTLIGILLVLLLLFSVLNAHSVWKMWLIAGIFMGWSGINIIGGVVSNVFGLIDFELNTFRWWTNFIVDEQGYGYMFRSNCDQLCSVYNQTIPPWLAVPLLIDKPKQENFIFLGLCVFAYAPFPFLGLVAIMFFFFIRSLLRCKKVQEIIGEFRRVFSTQNLIALFIIFPVFAMYYLCNIAATSGASGGSAIGLFIPLDKFSYKSLIILLCFYFIQFGIYILLIKKEFLNDALFKFISISMCIVPLFQIGTMGDFCWNVSVPFFFLLMIYCIKFLFLNIKKANANGELIIQKQIIGIAMCLTLAALDPFTQIAFGFRIAYENKTFDLMCRGIGTLSDKEDSVNFLTPHWEQQPFYKWLARENDYVKQNNLSLHSGHYVVSPKQNASLCLVTDGTGVFLINDDNSLLLSATKDGNYKLKFTDYQVMLDVPQCVVDENGSIWVWDVVPDSTGQRFILEEVDGYYMICYQEYALTYDLDNNLLKLSNKTGDENQLWSFQTKG